MSTTTPNRPDGNAVTTSRWRIDPARSSVEFRTPTLWGLTTVNGHFERYDGTLDFERSPAIELTIDAGSLDTKNGLRDNTCGRPTSSTSRTTRRSASCPTARRWTASA